MCSEWYRWLSDPHIVDMGTRHLVCVSAHLVGGPRVAVLYVCIYGGANELSLVECQSEGFLGGDGSERGLWCWNYLLEAAVKESVRNIRVWRLHTVRVDSVLIEALDGVFVA